MTSTDDQDQICFIFIYIKIYIYKYIDWSDFLPDHTKIKKLVLTTSCNENRWFGSVLSVDLLVFSPLI